MDKKDVLQMTPRMKQIDDRKCLGVDSVKTMNVSYDAPFATACLCLSTRILLSSKFKRRGEPSI